MALLCRPECVWRASLLGTGQEAIQQQGCQALEWQDGIDAGDGRSRWGAEVWWSVRAAAWSPACARICQDVLQGT
jgi:hypothetical protein